MCVWVLLLRRARMFPVGKSPSCIDSVTIPASSDYLVHPCHKLRAVALLLFSPVYSATVGFYYICCYQ